MQPRPNSGNVSFPQHPGVSDEDHYLILQHAAGLIDLPGSADGLDVIRRYKTGGDAAMGGKPPRIPEIGELPPSHLTADERADWLERQRTQALLPGEE